jgi:putative ABC transport system permease protein
MSASTWRAVLRMARRDAWRHKGRSLLVLTLIGLPVLVLGVADIGYRTWQLTPTEKLDRQIGAADIALQWNGGVVAQNPGGWLSGYGSHGGSSGESPTSAQVAALLPAGSRVIEEVAGSGTVRFRTAAGIAESGAFGLDYTDPIARGLVHQVSGRAPEGAHEIVLTTALAASTGLRVGDAMHLIAGSTPLTIVGTVRDASYRDDRYIYGQPAALAALSGNPNDPAAAGSVTWLAHTPQAIPWSRVRQLNTRGYVVVSRQAYLHPPPKSQISRQALVYAAGPNTRTITVLVLVAGMALLEVVLLAGPAFAVGARRRRRDLALVAAIGGRRRDLRNVVLASGVVLGVAAGVASVLAAIGLAAAGMPVLEDRVSKIPGPFDVHPLDLGVLAAVGLITAVAAAIFPARNAARTDVVAALAGRRGDLRTQRRFPIVGAIVAALGAAVALVGATGSNSATIILVGVVLIELGLIACTPTLLGLTSRLGAVLPLAPRLALRDAGRNRSAAAPAVAAVMASVIGAVALVVALSSSNDQNRRNYQPSLPSGAAYTILPSDLVRSQEVAAVQAAMNRSLPTSSIALIRGPVQGCPATAATCAYVGISVDHPVPAGGNSGSQQASAVVLTGALPPVVVDDGSGVAALYGRAEPAAVAALRAGRAVVDTPSVLRNGQATIVMNTETVNQTTHTSTGPTTRKMAVPAVAVAPANNDPAPQLILPPSLADQLRVPIGVQGVYARDTTTPTDHQVQATSAALNNIDPDAYLIVERGYHDKNHWLSLAALCAAATIAIGAAMIATALANVDGRADLVTLGAVGASPRTRRVLSMSRAGVIAGIGSAVGLVAGFVAPAAWVLAVHRQPAPSYSAQLEAEFGPPPAVLHLVVPWPTVAALLVGIPLVAALVAGATSRSRLPSERPAA